MTTQRRDTGRGGADRARPSNSKRPIVRAGATIHEHRLRNGLEVILVERHLDPVVAVMTWYPVGSRNERDHEAGVSHFLEHMMFKGSRRYGKGEVDLVTARLGGKNNAFTSSDHTAYWFEFASDRWELALEIEADRMQHLRLDPAEFEAEKAVVLEELSMGRDDPWQNLHQEVQTMLYPRHTYGRPIIGYEDSLAALTVEGMRDYFERFYHPGNATIVVCGDFKPSSALKAIREHFGKIPAGPVFADADCFRGSMTEPSGERRLLTSWDDPGSRVIMAWPGAVVGSDEDHALDVISAVLTGGRLSRMYQRLVQGRGIATSISTSNDARVETGPFWLYGECGMDVEPSVLEAAIDAELERIVREPIEDVELDRARRSLDAHEAFGDETVSDLARSFGSYAVDANWRMALEGARRRARLGADDLQRVARSLLRPERRVVGWSLPRQNEEDAPELSARKPARRGRKSVRRAARSAVGSGTRGKARGAGGRA